MKRIMRNIFSAIFIFAITLMNFSFADTEVSSANIPSIIAGLIPVKYQNNAWVEIENTTDNPWYTDKDWYDYENGIWANAKLNDGTMYVWIPRFTYKIEAVDGSIKMNIKWSDGKIDDLSEGYLSHPAFYFGEYVGGDTNNYGNFIERNGQRNELTGFWIQKDLFSTSTSANNAFDSAIKMTQNSSYGLPQSGTYTHMTKASEWGALAYLTLAKGNTNGNSTTNNSTGVNINNSVEEYVAGLNGYPQVGSYMLSTNYKKYRDTLNKDTSKYIGYALNETAALAKEAGKLADDSFLVRGGNLGLFGYSSGNGKDSKGARTSISVITEELTDTIAFFDTETSVVAGDYLILGVDFNVGAGGWRFPENPDSFFEELEGINGKKIVDIECLYEGSTRWHQQNLNAEVIKMIKPDMSVLFKEQINSSTTYSDGKYTLVVRVGGSIGDTPVFMPLNNMDVKIVVNELNLKDSSGDLIKIGNIPNNKVRLNIFGAEGNNVITKVVLKEVPVKTDYDLEEELNLTGGLIVPYLGNLAGEEISITTDNVVDKNITNTPGQHLVELVYNGITVTQDDVEFKINVSDAKQVVVNGEVKVDGNISNSQLLEGPGKYSRKDTSVEKSLKAYEYLSGYMFSSWSSNSSIVKASSSNSNNTTFTVPSRTDTIDKDEITITANYVSPDKLTIEGQKTEFIVGQDFSLGSGILNAVYRKDGSEVKRTINLSTSGVTVTLKSGNENYSLDNLPAGKYLVAIEYATKLVTYNIEVVNQKYMLSVYTNSMNFGTVNGDIKDADNVLKDNITLLEEINGTYKAVSFGNTVTLEAVPKDGYALSKWIITGKDDLIPQEELTNNIISFIMPESNVRIDAEFCKVYTVKFNIKQGQESYGTLEGTLEQHVFSGTSSTPVTAKANDNYKFNKWLDSESRIVSTEEEFVCTYVTKDEEYVAVFDNVWKVEFYNEGVLFKTLLVANGESANITETPTKYAYVFTGWDHDLGCITSDLKINAKYVPRINIEENLSAAESTIDAQITGTMIQEGTLQYLISEYPDNPEGIYTTYELDDIFTGFEGNWYNLEGIYRSYAVAKQEDSSAVLTISSGNDTEIVKFDYILSSSEGSQLGITINGEKVITPSDYVGPNWSSFEREIPVVDGKIVIGISYSQGENRTDSDFAAIRNLAISRKWTVIDNNYHLFIPTEFSGSNYIHVKGTGSDDLTTIYRAVSEAFYSAR